jgi:hypothetical protein
VSAPSDGSEVLGAETPEVVGLTGGIAVEGLGVGATLPAGGSAGAPICVLDVPCSQEMRMPETATRPNTREPKRRNERMAAPYFSMHCLAMGS